MYILIGLYGCLFLFGVYGNGTIALSLFRGPGIHQRNPFVIAMVFADLIVCIISIPMTVTSLTITWTVTAQPIFNFLQVLPVTASTLMMMVISIDRYLTVKDYSPLGDSSRRRPYMIMIVAIVMLLSCMFSVFLSIPKKILGSRYLFIFSLLLVHVSPPIFVLICHIAVYIQLTAMSLSARAKHGEIPLPLPLLRKPTNVIIVGSVANRVETETVLAESIREPQPGTSRRDDPEEPEELFEPENSTLQCRRRLARYLLWMSIFFAVCWIPHVICTIYEELFNLEPSELQWYSLFLGHFHSAVSPTIYRSLNIQCPRPPTYRTPNPPRSDSSTNEAYLGPFHPRYFRPPPQRRNSSLCLF